MCKKWWQFRRFTKHYKNIYVDDLKLCAKSDDNLEDLLSTIKRFNNDVEMHFDLEKCSKLT